MRKYLWISALSMILAAQGRAAATPTEALAEYETYFKSATEKPLRFLGDVMQRNVAFTTGSHGFGPVAAHKLLGFNVTLWGGGAVTPIDKSGANSGVSDASVKELINALPAVVPSILGGLNAKVGVPAFLFFEHADVGLRYGGLGLSDSKNSINYTDIGFDFRGNVLEAGLMTPITLTLGLSADYFKGDFKVSTGKVTVSDSSSVPGYSITGTLDGEMGIEMQNVGVALKAVVSRSFLFFTPYFGLGAQINTGSAMPYFKESGQATATGGSATAINWKSQVSTPVQAMDVRLGAGFELNPAVFFISANAEYGIVSGGIGGSAQIGVNFR